MTAVLGVPFDAFSFALLSPAEYASVLYTFSTTSCDSVCTVLVCVSSNCALCVESVVMQDAAPAGMWLQAFSAIHCNCQDASVGVYKQN